MTIYEKRQIQEMRLKGMGYKSIASVLGKSRDTIRAYCKLHNLNGNADLVKLNVNVRKELNQACKQCGIPIKQVSKGRVRRFCCDDCRYTWWKNNANKKQRKETAKYKTTCLYCGKDFICYGNKKRKFDTHECYINHRFWRNKNGI